MDVTDVTVSLAQWEKILYNNLEYSMHTLKSRTVTGGREAYIWRCYTAVHAAMRKR